MVALLFGAALGTASLDAIGDAMQRAGEEPPRIVRIVIEGNTITSDRVIRNQLRFGEGKRLRYARLAEARGNLMRLGIFDGDEPPVVGVVSPDDSPYKVIRVRVKETRTGLVGHGVNVGGSLTLIPKVDYTGGFKVLLGLGGPGGPPTHKLDRFW